MEKVEDKSHSTRGGRSEFDYGELPFLTPRRQIPVDIWGISPHLDRVVEVPIQTSSSGTTQ
eukprot:12911624-Prorocentrum_lima.AAC.1